MWGNGVRRTQKWGRGDGGGLRRIRDWNDEGGGVEEGGYGIGETCVIY